MFIKPKTAALISLSLLCFASTGLAQSHPKELADMVAKDGTFWTAYNSCDVDALRPLFTDDVEFYHDKGGATIGLENFLLAVKKGMCSNPDSRLRRAAVERTVQVFSLEASNKIYGAIISGEHVFYVREKGKPEYLDGRARFLQMWLLKDGVWKMSRILSYDHGPANLKGGVK